ncbi:hypothetical protein JCM10213_008444 [Rhodosporidiobolus nylandii]
MPEAEQASQGRQESASRGRSAFSPREDREGGRSAPRVSADRTARISHEDHPSKLSPTATASSAALRSDLPPPAPRPFLHPLNQRDFITQGDFFPTVFRLFPSTFSPYLLDQPIEPAWSSSFHASLLRFFQAAIPSQQWSSQSNLPELGDDFEPVMKFVQEQQPDKAAIQAAVGPLGSNTSWNLLRPSMQAMLRDLRQVMRWIWEDEQLGEDEVAWVVKHAPTPVYLLIRENASTLPFARLVRRAEVDFSSYLSRLPHSLSTPQVVRTIMLLEWLNEARSGLRKVRFFCSRGGGLRRGDNGEEPWEWWFASEGGKKELDVWEDAVLMAEDWGQR